jgi:FlaA1/EpsC-like NDP-sugar epimerase
MAAGGEVFILDMGKPVRIMDMARELIELTGQTVRDESNPNGDIEITITGLRPGEKLYEELLVSDGAQPTKHPGIFCQTEHSAQLTTLMERLHSLQEKCTCGDVEGVINTLQSSETNFTPTSGISDLVWKKRTTRNA